MASKQGFSQIKESNRKTLFWASLYSSASCLIAAFLLYWHDKAGGPYFIAAGIGLQGLAARLGLCADPTGRLLGTASEVLKKIGSQ